MSKIKIDHAQVDTLAGKYKNAEDTVAELLGVLKQTQIQLEAVWEGKAWDQFSDTYKQFEPKVKEFGTFLGSVGKQLKENARVMKDADEALNKANKLQ